MNADEPEAPWRILNSKLVYDGSPFVRVFKDSLVTGTGKQVDDFHRVEARDFVLVFARDAERRIVMLRQWRQGPQRFALCFPGGHVEPGEEPTKTALRELAEETGYTAPAVRSLGRFCMHSNFGVGWGDFVLAATAEPGVSMSNPDLETAQRRLVTTNELEAALQSGEIATVHDALCARLALAAGG